MSRTSSSPPTIGSVPLHDPYNGPIALRLMHGLAVRRSAVDARERHPLDAAARLDTLEHGR